MIKIGVFGIAGRGKSFFDNIMVNNGEIVAVCDIWQPNLDAAKKTLPDVATYTDFDSFIEHEGMDAILVSNYFHEHAPYAIRALEKNIHVLSECVSNGTMAEGVALVRAAEKSKAIYMLAENYPFMIFNQEMRRVYRGGTLGKVLFAEGEYNHPLDPNNVKYIKELCPHSKHWRYQLPRTYYITHSLAPLMYITGAVPKRVSAMPVFDPIVVENGISKGVPERAAIITCLNHDNSVYRVTGCASFGCHENSYRICAENGQIENLRDGSNRVLLNYDSWNVPDGKEVHNIYAPEWPEEDREAIERAGHGGGDFFVIKEFFNCIREGRQPEFDVYFATTTASVGILGHRSMLENGVPYDIPDFRKEEDRLKYENDTLTPFYGSDGSEPTIRQTNFMDYYMSPERMKEYDEKMSKI